MNKPTTRQILVHARMLIERPEQWTKGTYARREDDTFVAITDPRARCFCSHGALLRANNDLGGDSVTTHRAGFAFAQALERAGHPGGLIAQWNDTFGRTHSEVLAMFDDAIEKAA